MVTEVKASLLFSTMFLYTLSHQSKPNTTGFNDPKEILYRELSADAYFNLPFHEKGDTAVSLRRQYMGNLAARDILSSSDYAWMQQNDPQAWKMGPGGAVVDKDFAYQPNQNLKRLDTMNPDAFTMFHLCYVISYMWRRGRKGIHRYFVLRDTYFDHMPFEIGYLTQTIMAKYQNVLELYDYSTKLAAQDDRKIGRPHLYFFYKNILEDCRTIIHLCNMIHEVTRKYRVLQYSAPFKDWFPVEYNPWNKFQDPAGDYYMNPFPDPYPSREDPRIRPTRFLERGIEGNEHEKYRHEDPAMFSRIRDAATVAQKEEERQHKLLKKQRNYFIDHAHFSMTSPTSRRTKRWRSNDAMVYGWDPDDTNR